ncbi:MAG: hypothetical protein KIT02_10600 [Devosia sp.]|uniref:DUF6058 family natural product biosynthesis protein n=1 Tax=Devosia sp. TaxID=1871048 RepID=UPI0024C7C5E2|nr:DUF6058 family natural product biosynthesis protein [Devosia sp.]UYN98407.1 MAG: hypothetical protein KIT02_10600 [Devosia sp.]
MTAEQQLRHYAERYFLRLSDFIDQAGLSGTAISELIAAGALPGPIYSIWPNGAFYSPIGGAHGPEPMGNADDYYAPAAIWWARRASLLDGPAENIARKFRDIFVSEFVDALRQEKLGVHGYPSAYDGQRFNPGNAIVAAEAEWADWISGGYGVCLRYWDAPHAITKACQRGLIVSLTDEGRALSLSSETLDHVLVAMQKLEAVMLPFAPHQRPHGTPGLWIDRLLLIYGIGQEARAAGSEITAAERYCA